MSNLKLPTMTIENLKRVHSRDGKIGYKTDIMWNTDKTKVGIYHHDSLIAVIDESGTAGYERIVSVSNAGWDSKTTIDRLNRILRDNTAWCGARIRNFNAELVNYSYYNGTCLAFNGHRFYSVIHSPTSYTDSGIITDESLYNGVH